MERGSRERVAGRVGEPDRLCTRSKRCELAGAGAGADADVELDWDDRDSQSTYVWLSALREVAPEARNVSVADDIL